MPTIPPTPTSSDGGPAWPEQYPVDGVETTMGHTLDGVDKAEYTDLRRQGLIKFSDAPAAEQEPTTAPRARQTGGSE